MKKLVLYIACALLFFSCANGQTKDESIAPVPAPKAGQQVATFGGGCFWATHEAMSELKGVEKVISGYAGGTTKNPTYEEVCTETTGHAESVQVYYDPKVISYENLAKAFFYSHDPTQLNRQGGDIGTSYRTIAFYRTPEEKATLSKLIKEIDESKHFKGKIVTQVVPFKAFYGAENYHQNYYKLHINDNTGEYNTPYLRSVSMPKVEKMRKVMKAYLKPEFAKG
jgi:peptide-methionine (S)-S-oxide reductase